MLKRVFVALGLLMSVLSAASSPALALEVGDAAPSIAGKVNWLRGEPISEFKEGEVYVLDFWAVWCGPCIASIPHINELQQQYKDQRVNVIGMAVWPRPNQKSSATKDFIAKREDMNYRVAEDIGNQVGKSYMEAANQNGIPTVMVIDRAGKLAWIGHPMSGLDEVLAKVVAGTFDVGAAKNEAKRRAEVAQKSIPLRREFDQAMQAQNWERVIELSDQLLALDAEGFAQAGLYKYFVLVTQMKKREEASRWGATLANETLKGQPDALNSLAWLIATNESIPDAERDYALALTAAQSACEGSQWKDPSIIDTLARVLAGKGDFAQAVAAQEKALALAPEGEREAYQRALDEYKSKAASN
ncbi:MAG TPA: hypothetical protein DEB06_02600 [Phycisphaerales bacterium]|nr:hypothetical protein [Phycisphaerales bacterium]